jgi:hypothetical protein
VSELRDACIDGSNVVRAGGCGVVLEAKTHLEAAGEELVRDRSTCQGVQDKDFFPGSGATIKRTGAHTHEDLVERHKVLRFVLKIKKLPEPVLEYGFLWYFCRFSRPCCSWRASRGASEYSALCLPQIKRPSPLDDGKVKPHVRWAQFFQEGFPKDEKVTSVLHGPTGIKHGEEHGDFEKLHTKGVRRLQNSEMIVLLLSLQKQKLATAIYLFGLSTLLSGPGLKHMRIRSHHDLTGTLVTPLLLGSTWWITKSPTCLPLSVSICTNDQH